MRGASFLDRSIRPERLLPGYFFHGEELSPARQFLQDLREALLSLETPGASLERFSLKETGWRDIVDTARTIPFSFSPWRIMAVEIAAAAEEEMTSVEQEILRAYFASPTPKTILVVLFDGKIRKTKPLYKTFCSLPGSAVRVEELKGLKEEGLFGWLDKRAAAAGKRISSDAVDRLLDASGNDLQRLGNELEKLITFVGDKKLIDVSDVEELSAGVRNYPEWELSDNLAKSDPGRILRVLNRRFQEGDRPERIFYSLAAFFRDLLTAKVMLREETDRKDIFRQVRPQFSEKFGNFYWTKLREFFGLVERFTFRDLSHLISRLEQVDLKIKTSDVSAQALFESFILEYCGMRKESESAGRRRVEGFDLAVEP